MYKKITKHEEVPFRIRPDLFDHSNRITLGLPKVSSAETFTIFAPCDEKDDERCARLPFCPKFNHGVNITFIEGCLRATWQACPYGEDSADGIIVNSLSNDGKTWSPPEKIGLTVHAQEGQNILLSFA